VITETLYGIGLLPRATQNLSEWARLRPSLACYFPDEADAENAAGLQRSLRRQGWQLETVDALIAVVALRHNLVLLTSDKDFAPVPSLKQENWLVP
jgi:predicted nucleic acid-binding protein